MDRFASYPEHADAADRAYLDSIPGIPDGSFVQGLIGVVSFVQPDGTNSWKLVYDFDGPVSQGIGLLHMAAVEMMARTPQAITNLSTRSDES